MKLKGKIFLQETDGRKKPPVYTGEFKELKKDYFLAIQITQVDDQAVSTTQSFYDVMKNKFSKIKVSEKEVNNMFTSVTLPTKDAKDVPHITLAYFADFREKRDVANDIDLEILNRAKSIDGNTFEFDVSEHDFQLVIATKEKDLTREVHFDGIQMDIETANTVGQNRDVVINLKPKDQKIFSPIVKDVFNDPDFKVCNAQKIPVPFHLTVAQANQFVPLLTESKAQHQKANSSSVSKEFTLQNS